MFSKQFFECGLEMRKYLYMVGVMAMLALAGSYWYLNYFLDEICPATCHDATNAIHAVYAFHDGGSRDDDFTDHDLTDP